MVLHNQKGAMLIQKLVLKQKGALDPKRVLGSLNPKMVQTKMSRVPSDQLRNTLRIRSLHVLILALLSVAVSSTGRNSKENPLMTEHSVQSVSGAGQRYKMQTDLIGSRFLTYVSNVHLRWTCANGNTFEFNNGRLTRTNKKFKRSIMVAKGESLSLRIKRKNNGEYEVKLTTYPNSSVNRWTSYVFCVPDSQTLRYVCNAWGIDSFWADGHHKSRVFNQIAVLKGLEDDKRGFDFYPKSCDWEELKTFASKYELCENPGFTIGSKERMKKPVLIHLKQNGRNGTFYDEKDINQPGLRYQNQGPNGPTQPGPAQRQQTGQTRLQAPHLDHQISWQPNAPRYGGGLHATHNANQGSRIQNNMGPARPSGTGFMATHSTTDGFGNGFGRRRRLGSIERRMEHQRFMHRLVNRRLN